MLLDTVLMFSVTPLRTTRETSVLTGNDIRARQASWSLAIGQERKSSPSDGVENN